MNQHDADGHEPEEREEDRERVSESVGAVLERMLPWGVSLVVHAALVLVALVVVWAVVTREEDPAGEQAMTLQVGPSPVSVVSMPPPPRPTIDTDDDHTIRDPGPDLPRPQPNPGPEWVETPPIFGELSDMPTPPGGEVIGQPIERTIFGRRPVGDVVYVIDASGSLTDTLPMVVRELHRSVRSLKPAQRYTVFFFRGGEVLELAPGGLQRATPERARTLWDWANPDTGKVVPGGATDPLPAIQRAMTLRPDQVILLSDNITGTGKYAVRQDRLLAEIDQLRKLTGGKIRIDTIQFLYPDPLARAGEKGTMQKIADETGGAYTFISGRELGLAEGRR